MVNVTIVSLLAVLRLLRIAIINNCVKKDKSSFWSGCNEFALSVGCNEFSLGVVMIILFYKIK